MSRWDLSEELKKQYISAMTDVLAELREMAGTSQAELGKLVGITRPILSAIECGRKERTWAIYVGLCFFFDSNVMTRERLRNTDAYPGDLIERMNGGRSVDNILYGHNFIHYDLEFLNAAMGKNITIPAIDTLYLSPLLFPRKPYHSFLKDDKLITEELNNPVNDSKKASKLFYVEVKNLTEQELQKELDHEEDLQTLRDFRPIDDTFMRVLLRGNIPFTHTF